MSERLALFEKAERSFRVAEQLLSQEDINFASSRTYYGFFYVAEALLKSLGLSFSRHGQLVSAYGLQFAKTQRIDPLYHRLLTRAYRLRELADLSDRGGDRSGGGCRADRGRKTLSGGGRRLPCGAGGEAGRRRGQRA